MIFVQCHEYCSTMKESREADTCKRCYAQEHVYVKVVGWSVSVHVVSFPERFSIVEPPSPPKKRTLCSSSPHPYPYPSPFSKPPPLSAPPYYIARYSLIHQKKYQSYIKKTSENGFKRNMFEGHQQTHLPIEVNLQC